MNLAPFDSIQLVATTLDSLGNALAGRTVTWASSAPVVATVSTSGMVTGFATGLTVIEASSEGVNAQATVTVALTPTTGASILSGTVALPSGAAINLKTLTIRDGFGAAPSPPPAPSACKPSAWARNWPWPLLQAGIRS